jgi:hypothetical protein
MGGGIRDEIVVVFFVCGGIDGEATGGAITSGAITSGSSTFGGVAIDERSS